MSGRIVAPVAGLATALAASTYWMTMSSQSQLLGSFPRRSSGVTGRCVALTFDDGPNEPFTSRLADLLDTRAVRATFFQVGRAVEKFPETSQALHAAGHVLGNHSYSHQLHRCFGEQTIDDEIRRTQAVFGEELNLQPRLYRPPWLARTRSTFRVLQRHDLYAVSGTFCHPFEVAQIDSRRIAERAVARVRPGGMIIFHDGYNGHGADRSQTLDATARVIDTLGERGWSFVTVDQLLGVSPYRREHEGVSC